MSRYSTHRLTAVHNAVSVALLCSASSMLLMSTAQAATMGKTTVTSTQNEPLAASIMMTDVKTANFSVNLANSSVYQKMGLQSTDSMAVNFVATSATTGQVIIKTTKPISMPFADIVLAINDGEQRHTVAKTLLMPLSGYVTTQQSNPLIATALPENELPALIHSYQTASIPLLASNSIPPPLIAVSALKTIPLIVRGDIPPPLFTMVSDDTKPLIVRSGLPPSFNNFSMQATAQTTDTHTFNRLSNTVIQANDVQQTSIAAVDSADILSDILTVQIVRNITARNNAHDLVATALQQINNSDQNSLIVPAAAANNINKVALNSYTVQRNDSLQLISQHIAQQNNLNKALVVQQIQTRNPNAFFKNNVDCLKVNAQLDLSNYEVIPSQQNLQAAIKDQQHYGLPAISIETKRTLILQPTTDSQATVTSLESIKTPRRAVKPVVELGHEFVADILTTLQSSQQLIADRDIRL